MPSPKPDYYAILGILRNATEEEIKSAYFEAARKLHPDRNEAPGETELFLQVQQAYEVLSNPKRRNFLFIEFLSSTRVLQRLLA